MFAHCIILRTDLAGGSSARRGSGKRERGPAGAAACRPSGRRPNGRPSDQGCAAGAVRGVPEAVHQLDVHPGREAGQGAQDIRGSSCAPYPAHGKRRYIAAGSQ
eukprot:5590756-Pyramimonas_sp.AAC.3